jgi:hypothetical protein
MDIMDSVNSLECYHKISGERLILRTEPHFFSIINKKDE